MNKRFIELVSEYRNRNNWPCPAEFVVPITCNNKSFVPLDAHDPLTNAYPSYGWYQMPYAAPIWPTQPPTNAPRNVNGIYYSSLWPLSTSLDQNVSTAVGTTPLTGWLTALKFSGGTRSEPMLNSVVVEPPNQWNALTGMINFNPYYTPLNNYFAGALLLRFKEDPSCALNAWSSQQVITILVAFAAQVGDELQQGTAIGNIICINSPTSFVVVLQPGSTDFLPSPSAVLIVNNTTAGSSLPGVFSASTQAFRYDGDVETSIITAYDAISGTVVLDSPLNKDFDPGTDFFLIDFNTDPRDDWKDFIAGGPRIFVPNGSNILNSYKGLLVQNYTLTTDSTSNDDIPQFFTSVIKYDEKRHVAYLSSPLPIKTVTPLVTNHGLYGSNSFFFRKLIPSDSKLMERVSLTFGSIKLLDIIDGGKGFQKGETIGTSFSSYFQAPPGTPFVYPAPNYILSGPSGTAFRGVIESVDVSGSILSIRIEQQGENYRIGTYFLIRNSGIIAGRDAQLGIPETFQTLEIYRRGNLDSNIDYVPGDFIFIPSLAQINSTGFHASDPLTIAPSTPQYFFPPDGAGNISSSILDIVQNGFPPLVISCDRNKTDIPESGIRQINSSFQKPATFGDWWAAPYTGSGTITGQLKVIYLDRPFKTANAGLTIFGTPAFVSNSAPLSNSGFLVQQNLETLGFGEDNAHELNYTGSRVSQTQAVCYEIELISISLPNLPLDNNIGGLISFYPYLYLELKNISAASMASRGIIYSNNPHAKAALFRINIDDTNTPLISQFIKLDGDGAVQTIKFRPNDDLYVRIYLSNGDLFETQQKDTAPPLPPNFFVQISAEFQIRRLY